MINVNRTYKITDEDVYYTLFIYASNTTITNSNTNSSQIGQPKPSHLINEDDIFINISGDIVLMNSFGYLNAE